MFSYLFLSALLPTALASYGFYVGKNLSANNATLLGGTGEEVSSHWLSIFPAADHPANATIRVGVTEDASFPGHLLDIPQVPHTFRYLSMEYSDYEGFPAPLTNGGVNEKGVGCRDIWATNRDELYYGTPNPQTGLQYSDLARIVMERASSAREGVQIMGDLIAEYGFATYGGNSHLLADADEGWVVWQFAGGQRLWAAERLGPDDVRVSYPGYIEDFPTNFSNADPDTHYMGSPNIVSYAIDHGWWNPNSTHPFNIFKTYGPQGPEYHARDGGFKYMSQAALENATRAMIPVTEADLITRVRDPRISDDESGYGQVVSLPAGLDPDLLRIWVAPTSSVTAPFVPWHLGVQSVPPEFAQHRYLTEGAASTFLSPAFQQQEATEFAGRLFKRVLYYTCAAPSRYLPLVRETLQGFEAASRAELGWVERGAAALIAGGDREAARDLLTFFSHARAREALAVGRAIVDALGTWARLTGRFAGPGVDAGSINDAGEGAQTVNCLVGWDPDVPRDQQ